MRMSLNLALRHPLNGTTPLTRIKVRSSDVNPVLALIKMLNGLQ